MQQPNLINFWVRKKQKYYARARYSKTKNLHANACTYTVYKNFKISKRVFFFPVLHHCEHLTYSWRQTRLCTIKGLFLIPLPVLLCLFTFVSGWCTWWLKGGKTWSFLGKVLKNSGPATLASWTMPAWMRAKKSVPEKHAGNELNANEEKHMCFATYKKETHKIAKLWTFSELNKIDTNLCVNSKVQILELLLILFVR